MAPYIANMNTEFLTQPAATHLSQDSFKWVGWGPAFRIMCSLSRLKVTRNNKSPTAIVPTLRRGNAASDAPASRNVGALSDEFPLRSARLYTHLDVGRNKPVRALGAGQAFPAFRGSEVPETPALAIAGRAYSGLHPVFNRLVYAVDPHRRQLGMTLIEIMIALLIGAFLLGGVMQIFVSSQQTNRMQENLSRLQENGRFALEFISKDIRRAGFQGCPSVGSVPTNVVVSAPVIPPLTENTLILGTESVTSNWNTTACGVDNKCISGTDAISLIYGESCSGNLSAAMASAAMADVNTAIQIPAINTCRVDVNQAVLVSNCSSVDIFRATSAGTSIQHPALSTAYDMNAELFIYRDHSYFIRESTSGSPGRSLWRLDNSSSNSVELVEGIEDMQILYGVDTDDDDDGNPNTSAPDGPANYYVSANNIPAPDWFRVISVRISLLAATLDDNLAAQPLTYTYNGETPPVQDRRIRRVFNTTIAMRNRLP